MTVTTEVGTARRMLEEMARDWRGEVPMKLHEYGYYGLGSAPPITEQFNAYVGHIECKRAYCR